LNYLKETFDYIVDKTKNFIDMNFYEYKNILIKKIKIYLLLNLIWFSDAIWKMSVGYKILQKIKTNLKINTFNNSLLSFIFFIKLLLFC